MTFIPNALSQNDSNNSTTVASSFVGVVTSTTGYNSIEVVIQSDTSSSSGGVKVTFYADSAGTNAVQVFSDTYMAGTYFSKSYAVKGPYYKIAYTVGSSSPSTLNIHCRLQTTSYDPQSNNTVNFNNLTEYQLDAFGKQRFTQPQTLLDIKFPSNSATVAPIAPVSFRQNLEQIYSSTYGNATTTFGSSKCDMVITNTGTGAATANTFILNQSRIFTTYQPGKSLLILCSGKIDPQTSGDLPAPVPPATTYTTTCTARIGYFSTLTASGTSTQTLQNGIFFQCTSARTRDSSASPIYTMATNVSVNIVTEGGATLSINQSNWNIDKMDGTGSSGIQLDFTKCQLFAIDMEWLGVGRIRFGFFAYGKIVYCHQVTNINVLTQPYTSSINLPLGYYLGRDTNQGEATMTQICSTIISEGGYNPIGRPFTASTGVSTGVALSTNVEQPVLVLRGGGNNFNHQNIVPSSISLVFAGANDIVLYRLYIFQAPYIPCANVSSDIAFVDVNPNYSACQYATAINNFTTVNGIMVDSGLATGKTTMSLASLSSIFNDQILHITANSDNISDILVLTCTCKSSSTAYATMNWNEVY